MGDTDDQHNYQISVLFTLISNSAVHEARNVKETARVAKSREIKTDGFILDRSIFFFNKTDIKTLEITCSLKPVGKKKPKKKQA